MKHISCSRVSLIACILLACTAVQAGNDTEDCGTYNLGFICGAEPKKPVAPPKPVVPPRTNFVKDQLVLLYPSDDQTKIKSITKRYNLKPISKVNLASVKTGMIVAKTNGQNPLNLSNRINKKEENVEAATNNIFSPALIASKPASSSKNRNAYSMYETGVSYVHKTTKGKGVTICMVDTPVDLNHPSFSTSLVDTFDLVEYNSEKSDSMLHGTAVAGILVSQNQHIGIAPRAKLLAIGAFTTSKSRPFLLQGASSDIAAALDICIQHDVDVINLSFTGGKDSLVEKVVNKAIEKGIIVVAAGGNGGYTGSTIYPALIPGVITATAVDKDQKLFKMANKGRFIDYAAPGVSVLTIAPEGKYKVLTGTSLSSAHLSGVIALLVSQGLSDKVDTSIDNILTKTVLDLGAPGRDQEFGEGLISASRALAIIKK